MEQACPGVRSLGPLTPLGPQRPPLLFPEHTAPLWWFQTRFSTVVGTLYALTINLLKPLFIHLGLSKAVPRGWLYCYLIVVWPQT
jgi:hypothetical protein